MRTAADDVLVDGERRHGHALGEGDGRGGHATKVRTITFNPEFIESYEPGWRARKMFTLDEDDTIDERLELAPPEQDYFVCRKRSMRRAEK